MKPGIFVNKIDHKLNNNEKVFSSLRKNYIKENIDVRKKIKEIFNSPKYVYKMDVIIKTKTETLNKTIIGISNDEILTFDNEKIKISDILDINLKN